MQISANVSVWISHAHTVTVYIRTLNIIYTIINMRDFSKGKQYMLWNTTAPVYKIYYGSTTQTLSERMRVHKKNKNCESTVLFECGPCDITLIENYPCNNKHELEDREAEYIISNWDSCVNKTIPGAQRRAGGKKQYMKQYNEEHKDEIKTKKKQYYELNKDEILDYHKQYYELHKDEILDYQKQYYEQHKDEILDYQKQYNELNKDKIKAYKKQYNEEHKDEIKTKKKQYNEQHKDEIKTYQKQYNEQNKDKLNAKKKQKVECNLCGAFISNRNIAAHKKTKKCQSFVK